MEELIKAVLDLIGGVSPRLYYDVAPEGAVYPYIVFRFPTSATEYQREDFLLDISIWDKQLDSTAVETLATSINNILDRAKIHTAQVTTSIYLDGRYTLPDPDTMIRRRLLRYTCKTYL